MKIISSSRSVNKRNTTIETVVEIQKDGMMNDVNDSIRLTFSFERNQIIRKGQGQTQMNTKTNTRDSTSTHGSNNENSNNDVQKKDSGNNNDDDAVSNDRKRKRLNTSQNNDDDRCIDIDDYSSFGTDVTYYIDLSKDHLKKERLIDIYIQAPGICPSIKEAVPLEEEINVVEEQDDDDDEVLFDEFDENGNLMSSSCKEKDHSQIKKEHQHDSTSKSADDRCEYDSFNDNDNPDVDRYAAYVDPVVMQNFLHYTGLDFDVQNTLFFLMTFPYYEMEWDVFGFLLSCVFGGESESDEESVETVHDDD